MLGPRPDLPSEDLEHIATNGGEIFRGLNGAHVLITGASGFIGGWMTESLSWVRDHLGVDIRATLLLRDPRRFAASFPHLAASRAIQLVPGSIETASIDRLALTHVVHAAGPITHRGVPKTPFGTFDVIATGTRRLLKLSADQGARRFLLLSSGAVYGPQPPSMEELHEDFGGGPDPMNPSSAYAEAKRAAELLCSTANHLNRIETVVARGFSFVGPRLPLDSVFAVGNFLADGLAGRPIRVTGDGRPFRSYLHAADAAIWLWTMLVRGQSGRAYNVGSNVSCTIRQLANEVGELWKPPIPVVVEGRDESVDPAPRYVPSIERASGELGLAVRIPRSEALRRTVRFYRGSASEEG